jgi:Holliday junction resolvase RusA-like endonuclease
MYAYGSLLLQLGNTNRMFISIIPVPKPRMTQRDKWQVRAAVLRYRMFCDELRAKYPFELPKTLELRFYLPMSKSWAARKSTALDGEAHQQRPDIDNLCKAVMDALSDEDSDVYMLHAEKRWSTTPGIWIAELGIDKM